MMAVQRFRWSNVVARGGVEPPTYRFSGGRSYQLSYLAETGAAHRDEATQTGLEPATFAVTGRRANQLRHWALLVVLIQLYRGGTVPPTGFEPALPP
jgi:hypothetical protein